MVSDWTAPTPVAGWSTADVVEHLLGWLPGALNAWAGLQLPDLEADLGARWAARADAVDAVLGDSNRATMTLPTGPFAGRQLAGVIDMIYTPDVYMHGLDLARAVGADTRFDPDFAADLLAGMRQMGDALRVGGQYGPAFPVDSDDPVDQLMAHIGRDPAWHRP